MNNNPPSNDLSSAVQWAKNYSQNSTDKNSKDNSISIFWITIVILLVALVAWWWWINYCPTTLANDPDNKASPMKDLKSGAQKTSAKLQIRPNGTVSF
jgi:nitric oxide reductase large subunit